MYQYYSDLLSYCMKYRRDRVMSALRGAARCKHIGNLEYFGFVDMVKHAGLWEAK